VYRQTHQGLFTRRLCPPRRGSHGEEGAPSRGPRCWQGGQLSPPTRDKRRVSLLGISIPAGIFTVEGTASITCSRTVQESSVPHRPRIVLGIEFQVPGSSPTAMVRYPPRRDRTASTQPVLCPEKRLSSLFGLSRGSRPESSWDHYVHDLAFAKPTRRNNPRGYGPQLTFSLYVGTSTNDEGYVRTPPSPCGET